MAITTVEKLSSKENKKIMQDALCRVGQEVETTYGDKAYIIGVLYCDGSVVYQVEEPNGDIDNIPVDSVH